jgi:hypothetical protein
MQPATRFLIGALLASPVNAAFWAFTQSAVSQTSAIPGLIWFGSFFRFPFELAFLILAAAPLSSALRERTSQPVQLAGLLATGILFGLSVFLLARAFGYWPGANPLWVATSFAVSGSLWFLLTRLFPPGPAEDSESWRGAVGTNLATLQPALASADAAFPWVVLGWLTPFLLVAALFVLS